MRDKVHKGTVYLVGAGPGDPDLLTLKAYRLIQTAQVVVLDRLVSPAILDLIAPEAERIYVGKKPGAHSLNQSQINERLIELASEGRNVVRLKGGDPFIFGRGGEEALALRAQGITVEVVPGITTAAGVSARLGMPLTHRGLATGVRFETGSCRAGDTLDLDWQSLADPKTTLVFYMGLANMPLLRDKLLEVGRAPETPVALIENATRPDERFAQTTLADMVATSHENEFVPPTLILIGEITRLGPELEFEAFLRSCVDQPEIERVAVHG
jgi:uroporphyrin-III C-methyltransferase/precorrin-2 dehydrogenase/sirohydrochlorin ferrochelatase/uroporphyrin-III C-methyltransferase